VSETLAIVQDESFAPLFAPGSLSEVTGPGGKPPAKPAMRAICPASRSAGDPR
jgi:hypothetical protein